MKRHQRNGIITAALLALAVVALCSSGCATTVTPLCRHIVLAHHAAAVDAGFEAETWRIKNPKPVDGDNSLEIPNMPLHCVLSGCNMVT